MHWDFIYLKNGAHWNTYCKKYKCILMYDFEDRGYSQAVDEIRCWSFTTRFNGVHILNVTYSRACGQTEVSSVSRPTEPVGVEQQCLLHITAPCSCKTIIVHIIMMHSEHQRRLAKFYFETGGDLFSLQLVCTVSTDRVPDDHQFNSSTLCHEYCCYIHFAKMFYMCMKVQTLSSEIKTSFCCLYK